MTYRRATRVDEVQNPIEEFILVPYEDLDELDLVCCREADQRERLNAMAEMDILADAAYIASDHWTSHGVEDLSNSALAQLVAGPGLAAGAVSSGIPEYTGDELDEARRRSGAARIELKLRNYADEDIARFEEGHLPED